MKKGISLVSLIVAILVIIILASMTVFSVLDTIEQAQDVKKEKEFKDVVTYVRSISNKIQSRTIDVSLTESTLASAEQISSMYIENSDESELLADEVNIVNSVNTAIKSGDSSFGADHGYHYVTSSQIKYGIDGIDETSNLDNVDNDYIINFYYGVVIARISSSKTLVDGIIK